MKRITSSIAAIAVAFLVTAGSARAFPVTLNVDSSYEGIASSGQTPLSSGRYRVGWFDAGTTNVQLQAWSSANDLTSIENAFNEVFSFSNLNSFGDGLPFESTTLVADLDAVGLAAYKNVSTGAAGKQVYSWIWNAGVIGSVTQHAIVTSSITFAAANAIDGSDFETNTATASDTPGITAVVGSINPVLLGGGVDLNGGSASDSTGFNGGSNVLVLSPVPEPSSALLILGGLGAMVLRRRRLA